MAWTLRWPLLAFVASRVVVLAAIAMAASRHTGVLVRVDHARGYVPWPTAPASTHAAAAFSVWDAGWYLQIAAHGYGPALLPRSTLGPDMAFYPLLPLLVRVVATLTGGTVLSAGIAVSLVVGVLASLAVWVVTRAAAGEDAANRAALVWCFFPGAFVLSLIYSEGLTVCCAALCLYGLLRHRWLLAGAAAAVATAAQPDALVLVACCVVAAEIARRKGDWSALAAPLLAPAGALGYAGYLWARTGDPLAWYHSESLYWWRAGPIHGLYTTVVTPLVLVAQHPTRMESNAAMLVAGLAVAVAGLGLMVRWRAPMVFWFWTVGALALALLSGPVGTRPRFLLVTFPLMAAAASQLPRWAVYTIVLAEAPLLAVLTYVSVTTLKLIP